MDLNSNIEHVDNNYLRLRIVMMTLIIILLFYSYKNFVISKNLPRMILSLIMSMIILFDYLYISIKHCLFHNLIISLISFYTLCIVLLILGHKNNIGRFWILLIPLVTFYTQGIKKSLFYLTIPLTALVVNMFHSFILRETDYIIDLEQLIVFILILFTTYFYEEKSKLKKELIFHQLHFDTLTGLPNRESLKKHISDSNIKTIALINIDDFKEINKLYGAEIGDQILKIVSVRLKNYLNKKCSFSLYKLHSDEFAIISESINILSENMDFISNIVSVIINEIKIEDIEINLSVRMGIYQGREKLIETADIALKKAKELKKNIVIYDKRIDDDNEYILNRLIIKKLRKGILYNNIHPYYQPIVKLSDNSICKYECLVRLISDYEIILPHDFLYLSKKVKLYPEITKIMIAKSFNFFSKTDLNFSINIDYDDIINKEIIDYIISKVNEFNIGSQVIFELLESQEFEDSILVLDFVTKVKNLGCRIALDDFGSGYSNFNYIIKLKVDFLKIDSSLIKNIDTDINSRIMTKSIVTFAKELNIVTIAEHIDREEVLEIVKELGIDYGQGYFLGEPKPNLCVPIYNIK